MTLFHSQTWRHVINCIFNFVGSSNCFLFSIKPFCEVYTATGYNENFMYLNQGVQTLPNGLVSTMYHNQGVQTLPNGLVSTMYHNQGVQTLPNALVSTMYLNQGVQTLPNGVVSTTCPDRQIFYPMLAEYTATGYNESFMYLNQGVQTLQNLIRVCTVWLCPSKRILGLYALSVLKIVTYFNISFWVLKRTVSLRPHNICLGWKKSMKDCVSFVRVFFWPDGASARQNYELENIDVEFIIIELFKQQMTMKLIRLCECTSWSVSL